MRPVPNNILYKISQQKLWGRFNHNIHQWKRLHFCINAVFLSMLRQIRNVRLFNYPLRYEIKIMNYSPVCTPLLVPFVYQSSSRCSITFLNYSFSFPRTHYRSQLSSHSEKSFKILLKEINNNQPYFNDFFVPSLKHFAYSLMIWKFPHTTSLFCFLQVGCDRTQ